MRTLTAQVVLALLLAPLSVHAQSATATLTGVVKDTTGAVLPGATVTARSLATNESRTALTASEGGYRLTSLPRGDYEVTAALDGFKTLTQSGVLLTVGEIVRLDFALEVGAMVETVEVTAVNRLVNVEEGRLSYLVNERQVNELPLNGRNAFQLMELQPGALANSGSVGPFGGGQAAGNTAFMNGQRNRANNFLLDGIDNNDQFTAGRVALNPNVDMIQEFRVSANNFSAEFGRNSSAAVTVVTKSGTNDFHGTAYDFFRNEALNARTRFTTRKDALRYNQFGATGGGPIARDRFFFFASYEGLRSRRGFTTLQTVETPEFRRLVAERFPNSIANFLFQQYPSPTPTQNIRDTGQPVAGLSQDHVDNTPSVAGNPNYVSTGGGFHFNTRQGTPDGIPDIGTAVVPLTGNTEANQFSLRLDTELSSSQRLFGRYIYDRKTTDRVEGEARSARFTRPGRPRTDHIAVGHTWIATNRIVSESRFGLNRLDINFEQRDPGVPMIGLNDGTQGFGMATILSTFVDTYQFTNTVSMSFGNHGIKLGGEYRHVKDDVNGPSNRPSMTFANIHDFAQDEVFFIGSVGVDPRSGLIASNVRHFRYNELGFFVQDDWKLRSNLTANAGLRYEWFGRPTEKDGLMGTIIPGPGNDLFEMVRTGTVGQVDSVMADDYNNFGPRLGLSWDPTDNGRLVLRGGYGLMYERLFNNSPENVRLNPPFYALTSAFPVFTAAHRGIPIAYGPTNPDGSRNLTEPLRLTGPNTNPGVASDSGVVGNLVAWNPGFGTSTQSLRVPDLFGRDSYSHNWFGGAQVDVGWNLALEANYVGNVGRNLGRLVDYNTQSGDLFDGRLDRLNRGFGGINYRAMNARSEYH
ncbi:MAG: TonB-dependent receptor domain-containing protein, partial [Vicinamibacterales bacterium]